MDVTCPACNTRYEFDEALVSSRGTTVKCTHCGHQFKVYRPEGASSLDGWTVRTVDGRELHFKAMRELQAAISTSRVSREDVLIPGDGAEPRRLGRIEELQSFFSMTDEVVPTTRRRRETPTGHTSAPPSELVATAVRGSSSAPSLLDREGAPVPSRTGDTLRPPSQSLPPDNATIPRAAAIPQHKPMGRDEIDSEPDTGVTRTGSSGNGAKRNTKLGHPTPASIRRANGGGSPRELPPDAAPTLARAVKQGSRHGQLEAVEALHHAVRDALGPDAQSNPSGVAATSDDAHAVMNVEDRELVDVGFEESTPHRGFDPGAIVPPARQSDDDTIGDPKDAEAIVAAAIGPPPARNSSRPPTAATRIATSTSPGYASPSLTPSAGVVSARLSDAPETPSPSAARPSILRQSEVYSDPRFSGYAQRGKRPGLARWVVGIVGIGVIAVLGFTFFKRHAATGESVASAAPADSRVDKFLEEGEARLAAGDLDGAKDHFNKASGVTESDPRVWRALARTEIIRADLLWLELEVADKEAPGRAGLKEKLAGAVTRGSDAAERAAKLAPDDPLTVSVQMDVLRLQGKGPEARKLSAKVDGAGPDADRARALLDLAEDKPNYGSVIDRLRSASRSERKLGRAQALLVYALVRADKASDAKKELGELASFPGSQSLVAALTAYVDGTKVAEEDSDQKDGDKKDKDKKDNDKQAELPRPAGPPPSGGHYELDEEPHDPTPLPDSVPDDPTPLPQPAPDPAPAPAPADTSDLPE